MSISASALRQLQLLVAADDTLQTSLRDAAEVDQAVALVVSAAARNGVSVDAAALKSYLLAATVSHPGEPIDDAHSDSPSGGSSSAATRPDTS